ncbi:MAG: recombination mediator RecR [Verrucomicrobiales bacterium]
MARVDFPLPVRELIAGLKALPGIGPRSAERVAIWLLQHPKARPLELATALQSAEAEVVNCGECGFFATAEGCPVCGLSGRDESLLCVVEQATDVLPIERSGAFAGKYHCLGGKLSPLDGVEPEDLRIAPLLRRVRERAGMEVILATGSDVEGEATAHYLAECLEGLDCRVTRLAQGLPAGGGLEFADELTLSRAFEGRR